MAITNLQALQSMVNLDLPNLHEKVLLDNGVTGTDNYTTADGPVIELCAAYVYKVELSHPEFSEGKLKIGVDRKALTSLMNNIFKKNNLPNEVVSIKPKIKIEVL